MTTKQLIVDNNFRFNHKLGQNFITDTNLLSAIVQDAEVTKADTVVEIGVGAATLTRLIAASADRVIGYEIDKRLKNIVQQNLQGIDNVNIVYKDFLKCNIDEIESDLPNNYKVVANLPYYITTPIIMLFVEQSLKVSSLTIMVQKEVAERISATNGNKDYSAVTVAIQAYCNVTQLRSVGRKSFYPVPNVDSVVVRLDFHRNNDIICRQTFRNVVRACFSMRRKTLVNNLMSSLNLSRQQATDLLAKQNLDFNIRSECLSVQQFIILSNDYYHLCNNIA